MVLEMRHLQAIQAIAEAGSLTRAAASLGVSQPSLTGQLQRLEKRLGGRLFLRDRQGAVPTPLGELVLSKARQVLPAMEELEHETARYTAEGVERMLRYGSVPGPLMAGPLQHLSACHGDRVTLRTESSARLLADLVAQGHLEFASILDHPEHPLRLGAELRRHVVAVEPAFALVPARGPLAEPAEVEPSALAGASWVMPPLPDNGLRACLAAMSARAGFTPRVVHETDASGARDLIGEGGCVGIGQATFRATTGIAVRPLAGCPVTVRHTLIWLAGRQPADLVRQMVSFVDDAYVAAVARSPAYLDWLDDHPGFGGAEGLRTALSLRGPAEESATGRFRH
ncbi:LysR family transcriptional regulator [Streptomyces sp. RKND-216]|nr:LysR family transcriptional regulator [Streptomyces sp. RKND-216]